VSKNYVEIQENKKESISQNFICQVHEFYACADSKAEYQQRDWRSQFQRSNNLSELTSKRMYFFSFHSAQTEELKKIN
jgi:AAA15 family ATPase/GTPase